MKRDATAPSASVESASSSSRGPAAVPPLQTKTPTGPVSKKSRALSPKLELAARRKNAPDAERPAPAVDRFENLDQREAKGFLKPGFKVLAARGVRPNEYSSTLGPVVLEENGFRIYEDHADGWAELKVSPPGKSLMVNPANGRLVVVTGTLKVTIESQAEAERLAEDEHLELSKFDPSIKMAFLRAPTGYRLIPALARIKARPGVTDVDLETVEGRAVLR